MNVSSFLAGTLGDPTQQQGSLYSEVVMSQDKI